MIRATLRKELVSLWTSPVPYIVCALVNVAVAVLFIDTLRARQQAVFQPMVPLAGFMVLAVAPALTMRTIAEETRSGTIDVLLASRARIGQLVVAKWLAAALTLVAVFAPISIHAVLLLWWGEPDTAPMRTGLLGLVVLALAATAIGVATSALSSSLPVAAMGAFVVMLLGWFVQPSPSSAALRSLGARLSISERVRGVAGGAVDTGSLGFFGAVTVIGLVVATAAVARRRAGRPLRAGACAATAIVVVLVAQTWLDENSRVIDLTAERSLSLSSDTTDLLVDLPGPMRITAFIGSDEPGRVEAVALLDRYERASRKVSARVLDPLSQPGELRRLGVDPIMGGVAIELNGKIEGAPSVNEQDVSLAIARLRRGELPRLCLTAGHGELDPASTLSNGLSESAGLLRDNGYELGTIDLLATPSVPDDCGAVLVIGPAAPLGEAVDALRRWYQDDGRLLVLAEAGLGNAVDASLNDLLEGTGISLLGGVVAEADPASVLEGDSTAPLIRRYNSGNPVVRNLPPIFLVGTGGVEIDDDDETPGRTLSRLGDTSASSLLVDDASADASTARPGPITVMAAVDESANLGGTVHRRRMVVVADADFLSNAFVDQAGNARLLVQAVDWLTVDDSLVSITSNLAEPRPLELTDARRSYALLLSAGIIPALALLAGALVWALRRRA